jgi:DUF917 family protein
LRHISKTHVDDIALGASFLAAGGGGNVEIGKLLLKRAIEKFGKVELITVDELRDDDFIVPLGEMGAPVVGLEKFGRGDEPSLVVKYLANKIGRKVSAVTAVEVGGGNSMIPMVAAAQLGVPMVDADSMGRAFPETQMTSYHIHGVPASPFALIDERGNVCEIEAVDTFWAERISRNITSQMGARSTVATFAMDGKTAKYACVAGTISLSQTIGKILNLRESEDKLSQLLKQVRGQILFRGKIMDVNRQTAGGFNKGGVTFQGMNENLASTCRIYFQNENLICYVDDRVVATVPDIITVLNSESLIPITTEELRYGFRTFIVGLPAAPIWRTQAGIKVAGPRYFGYDVDYIPVEDRIAVFSS